MSLSGPFQRWNCPRAGQFQRWNCPEIVSAKKKSDILRTFSAMILSRLRDNFSRKVGHSQPARLKMSPNYCLGQKKVRYFTDIFSADFVPAEGQFQPKSGTFSACSAENVPKLLSRPKKVRYFTDIFSADFVPAEGQFQPKSGTFSACSAENVPKL